MKITYFDTLYKREATMMIHEVAEFKQDGLHFASMGRRYCIRYEHIIKIERVD